MKRNDINRSTFGLILLALTFALHSIEIQNETNGLNDHPAGGKSERKCESL